MSLKDKVDDDEGLHVSGFSLSCQSTITVFLGLRSFLGKTVAYVAL